MGACWAEGKANGCLLGRREGYCVLDGQKERLMGAC